MSIVSRSRRRRLGAAHQINSVLSAMSCSLFDRIQFRISSVHAEIQRLQGHTFHWANGDHKLGYRWQIDAVQQTVAINKPHQIRCVQYNEYQWSKDRSLRNATRDHGKSGRFRVAAHRLSLTAEIWLKPWSICSVGAEITNRLNAATGNSRQRWRIANKLLHNINILQHRIYNIPKSTVSPCQFVFWLFC